MTRTRGDYALYYVIGVVGNSDTKYGVILSQVRGFLADCWDEALPDGRFVSDLNEEEACLLVDSQYEGGIEQFVKDIKPLLAD